ncbi:CNP1-like family protein [Azoarcus sp. KH32C]|uniref:CNP1-like family protein n=1 Tax=Azoarcus sp. KH32C TaxID=748247 RepID=UPI0002386E77|nr:CNP1-like family protein [Azoarcus sp. KH32C]BAL23389.1 hypothetical protein AZKH_1053 [Azoarcus sp. KH32C]
MTSPQSILRGGLVALALLSGPSMAGLFNDADKNWTEGEWTLPAAPNEAALREFFVSSASPNKFMIDESSISVGQDSVVRYVLMVRTPAGGRNVTFEGIRCATAEWRIYATGRDGGEWSPARGSQWQPITNTAYNRTRAALAQDYFCDGPVPPRDRDEVLQRLRNAASGKSNMTHGGT